MITGSPAATAIPKWSRGTARICWLSTLLRKLHDERTRSTGALPRFGGPHEARSHNAPSLVLRCIRLMTVPLSLGSGRERRRGSRRWSTPLSGRSMPAISTGACRNSKTRPRRALRPALQSRGRPGSTTDRRVFAADLLQVQQRETIGSSFDCKSRPGHWQDGMLFAIIREGMA